MIAHLPTTTRPTSPGARPQARLAAASPAGPGRLALAALPLWVSLLGCASYPDRLSTGLRDFELGNNQRALEVFADRDKVKSGFLVGAEAGTVAFADLDWPGAVGHFERAVEAVRQHEDQGLIGESTVESLGTLLYNETASDYAGEGYERVLLHTSLALCYLAQGNLDGLRVETKRANQLLEREEEVYQKRYAAGGLGHFVSAVAYLLEGDKDDALIDLQRMLEKDVGTGVAGPEAARLIRELGRQDEFPDLLAAHPDYPRLPDAGDRPAWVVVIAGVGLAPFKEERSFAFPTPAGVISMAVPAYVSRFQPVSTLSLELPLAGTSFELGLIEDVERVARENLDDRLAALAVKTALRNAARLTLRNSLKNKNSGNGGAVAALAVDIYGLITERADLRSWLTLPKSFQALRIAVPAGEHDFRLVAHGATTLDLGRRYLEPGETVFVLGRNVGSNLQAALIGGQAVVSASDAGMLVPAQAADLLELMNQTLEAPAEPLPGQP